MHNTAKLRQLFQRPGILQVAGAHDALSAKLAEQAGFDAIWASGFGISASYKCIPDASFITLTEQLDIERNMAEAVSIPIIADCDTGYGNALNVMRVVRDHERAGIAAICIEDNVYPKRCSFYAGVRRELVPINEHCGKIRAAKAAQTDPDFIVIARTEALIAGWGKAEALKRVEAYVDAGADAILIHSKAPTFDELRDVARSFSGRVPLVSVPTTYEEVTIEELAAAGFKVVIYANQAIRAAIHAMRTTFTTIVQAGNAKSVREQIVPLQDVYELVGVPQMRENEQRFLPVGGECITAIIAAAGFEKELLPLIQDRPKCLLDIKGKTILERQVDVLNECNIKEIAVVRGYQKQAITLPNIRYYDNDLYEETGELFSFFCAEPEMKGRCIFLYGDIVFDAAILQKLLRSPADIALVVDLAWGDRVHNAFPCMAHQPDLVILDSPPGKSYRFFPSEDRHRVVRIGPDLPHDAAHGEFIGLAMFSDTGINIAKQVYRTMPHASTEPQVAKHASLTDLLQAVIDAGYEIHAVPTYKGWLDVDSFEDYQKAWAHVRR
ncbi:MAG: phosphoenolpyruvate mutase [Nitrospirae bacterium]|nr:MAG: phosphoenolpyruvate mutase [Nitrospirota bacterium]